MSNILVTVNEQKLHITQAPTIAAQGVNEDYVVFTLDSYWSGFGIIAFFYRKDDPDNIYQAAVNSSTGKALIPHEVTASNGVICFGIYGVKNSTIIYTSEVQRYRIVEGRYVPNSTPSEPITPGVYEQLVSMVGSLEQEMAEFIATYSGYGHETTLWTGTKGANGDTFSLSDNASNYDYIDVFYTFSGTEDVKSFLASNFAQGAYIRSTNLSDDSTGTSPLMAAELKITPTTSGNDKNYTINSKRWTWSGEASAAGSQVNPDSTGYQAGYIFKIVGRKRESDSEIQNARIGYDGTTYQTAGAAIRGQVSELHSGKQDVLTFDTEPTEDSTNPITSGAVYEIAEEVTSLSGDLTELSETIVTEDSTLESGDLYLTDKNGYALVELSDGHFKTKHFDSRNYTIIDTAIAKNYSPAAYSIGDYVYHDGKIYTCNTAITVAENWNESHWTEVVLTDSFKDSVKSDKAEDAGADMYITDKNGYALFELSGGHIKTKNFDSEKVDDGGFICCGTFKHGDVLFDSSDVSPGETIYYSFTSMADSGGVYIDILNTSNQRITYIGRPSNGVETNYCGTYTIPNGFSTAKAKVSTANAYLLKVYCVAKAEKAFGMLTELSSKIFGAFNNIDKVDDIDRSINNRLANPLYETYEHYNETHQTGQIQKDQVLTPGITGAAGYRIPTVVVTNAETALVAAEHRTNAIGDYGDFSLDVGRKALNGSWSISEVIPFDSTRQDYGNIINPCFLVDRNSGRIYLFYGTMKTNCVWWDITTENGDFRYVYSDDDGVTWSSPVSLKNLWDTETYDFCIPSCTKGITLTNGTLVVPCFCKKGTSSSGRSHSLILYKTSGGNWTYSSVVSLDGINEIDECAVVEGITNNEIWLYCRCNTNYGTGNKRSYLKFIYSISGDSFVYQESNFDTNRSDCFGIDRITINSTLIYLMTFIDANGSTRNNITLWASLDGDKWIRIYRIHKPSGNGYSVIDNYGGTIYVAYEDGSSISCQDLSNLSDLINSSATTLIERNISVQDRLQLILNAAKGIE